MRATATLARVDWPRAGRSTTCSSEPRGQRAAAGVRWTPLLAHVAHDTWICLSRICARSIITSMVEVVGSDEFVEWFEEIGQ
jgi:hypothetical protein